MGKKLNKMVIMEVIFREIYVHFPMRSNPFQIEGCFFLMLWYMLAYMKKLVQASSVMKIFL